MQLIEGLIQNTPEWAAFRLNHYGASEAAAMLGVSPYMTRDELLRQKKTGITPEVSEHQQALFNKGHRFEGYARPIAEQLLRTELFPCVGVLEGTTLSASFDGLTMDERLVWEHKLLNDKLREVLPAEGTRSEQLPLHYRVQLEQQLLVSGAEKALFWASDFNEVDDWGEKIDCRYCWYTSDPELRQRLLDGWQQFEKDLAAYQVKDAPAPLIGQTPEALDALPVLHIAASGQLIASNLSDFKEKALNALAQINTDLQTDQDFADAESATKACKDIESRLGLAKESLYVQAGIALVIDELNHIQGRFKNTRLALDKTIKHKKDSIKQRYIEVARQRVREYIETLNEGFDLCEGLNVPASLTADLTAAIKGLKTLSSIQNALDSVVLRYESEANQEYERKQQQAKADAIEAESEGEPVVKRMISLNDINQAIYPLSISGSATNIPRLTEAAIAINWPAIKQALINHIEQAIPA